MRPLVGRQRQLSELSRLIGGIGAGRGSLVLLSGEAGAGKTRLAEEAAQLATDAGVDVAWTTGWGAAAAPLSAWSDLLASLRVAVPTTGVDDADADPEVARSVFVRALVSQLRAAVEGRCVLLVVDDVQWCDALSVHVIEALAPALRTSSIGILATLRIEDDTLTRFDALARRGQHLIVPPLTDDELRELGRVVTGRQLSAAAVTRLRDRSAGNVLFATGLLEDAEPAGVSSAVKMFEDRLLGLTPEARRVLEAASLIGRRFRLDVLAETLTAGSGSLLATLGEAHRAGLIREGGLGAHEFVHPLMAEACSASADLPRRIRLHRDIGEALERLRDRGFALPSSELAYHFAEAAAAGVPDKAARYAAASGRENMEQLAYEDAARDFQLALTALVLCPADDESRTDLFLDLGDAQAAAGDLPSARAAYESAAHLARRHVWPDRLARAALGVGSGPGGFEVPALDRDQIAMLEEAASVATGTQRAQVIARLSVALSFDADAHRRARLSDEAIAAARLAEDPVTLGYALASQCDVFAGPADVERRLIASDEILACATSARDTRLELLGRRLRIVALLESGHIAEVDEQVASYAERSDRLSQVVYSWYVPLWRAMRAAMEGRLDDASGLRGEAVRLGEVGHSNNAVMLTGSQEAMLHCELGMAGPIEFFEDVMTRWPALAIMGRPGLAYGYASIGDIERAKDVLAAVDLDEYTVEAIGSEWLPSVVMLAHAAAACDDKPSASRMHSMLLPFRARHAIDGIGAYDMGSVERVLGSLAAVRGDEDGARDHFDRALHQHRRLGARLLLAGTLRDAGRVFGDASLLNDAESIYVGLGLAAPDRSSDQGRGGNFFRQEGALWLVGLNGSTTHLRDTKGMRDLAQLLAQPGREVHVLDLVAVGPTLHSSATGDAIDGTARRRYRARLVELEEELDDAGGHGDVARSERLQAERDALLSELSGAYGLGGRSRRRGDSSERARSTVTQRLRDAIGRIEVSDPALGSHLRRSVRTGTFCSYAPEQPMNWIL